MLISIQNNLSTDYSWNVRDEAMMCSPSVMGWMEIIPTYLEHEYLKTANSLTLCHCLLIAAKWNMHIYTHKHVYTVYVPNMYIYKHGAA